MDNYTRVFFVLLLLVGAELSAQPGGTTSGWANIDPATLGPKTIDLDCTDCRVLPPAPAVGVHPRVYFGPDELPAITDRLTSSVSGQAAYTQIKAYNYLLNKGFNNGNADAYNQNADYALDEAGNRRISNAGKWNSEPLYTALVNEDEFALDAADNKSRYLLASMMALEAFECLVEITREPLATDPNVGISYLTRADNLATAMATWADIVNGDPLLNWDNYNHFGGVHMALAYDLNYHAMKDDQRDAVRTALASIIAPQPRYGAATEAYATTSNWVGLNTFELLTNLAIEGEQGYNPTLNEQYMRAYWNFLTYGWYASGAPYEGLGKNYQFVTSMIAMAKRGYSLLGHPHLKTYGQHFLPQTMQPYGYAFNGTDVWGGTGWDENEGFYRFSAADVIGLKFVFPDDERIDFVWRNYIERGRNLAGSGYRYQQIEPATSGYHNYALLSVIFPEDYNANNWETLNANARPELSFLAPERGLATLRSGQQEDDLMVYFHCRQDLGGHTHADRNTFTLSALGRIFLKYSFGSAFQNSEYHSIPLIDGEGIRVTNRDGRKARQPGRILDFVDEPLMGKVAGDATYAYSWEWDWESNSAGQDHSRLGIAGWTEVEETWNDFRYQAGNEFYHETPFYDYADWRTPSEFERMIKRPFNPMERVQRTLALVRAAEPFVITTDDLKKDDDTHTFRWQGQLAADLSIVEEATDYNPDPTDWRHDVVVTDVQGNRMLVRILEADGVSTTEPASLERQGGFNGNVINRLVIEAEGVVEPGFKLLFFPHRAGEALPVTSWNADRTELQVIQETQVTTLTFPTLDDGRTDIVLESSEGTLPVEWLSFTAAPLEKSILLNWTTSREENNAGFTLERSTDGRTFTPITWVAAGEGYRYEDAEVVTGPTYYYRLRQRDHSGAESLSRTVSARMTGEETKMRVYPQPAKKTVMLSLVSATEETRSLRVYNLNGQLQNEQPLGLQRGYGAYPLALESLAPGIYLLRLEGRAEAVKLIVSR